MDDAHSRNIVASLWAVLFAVALLIPLGLFWSDWIGQDWLDKILGQVNRSYAAYVGPILGFYFISRRSVGSKAISREAVVVAVSTALVWNGFNLFFLLSLMSRHLGADAAVAGMDKYSSMLNWIAGPAIGFFFGAHYKAKAVSQ